jgi:hypothetical protein
MVWVFRVLLFFLGGSAFETGPREGIAPILFKEIYRRSKAPYRRSKAPLLSF